MLESLVANLDPSVRPMEEIQVYMQSQTKALFFDPSQILSKLLDVGLSYKRLLAHLPRELTSTIRKLSQGKFVIQTANADLATSSLLTRSVLTRPTIRQSPGVVLFLSPLMAAMFRFRRSKRA